LPIGVVIVLPLRRGVMTPQNWFMGVRDCEESMEVWMLNDKMQTRAATGITGFAKTTHFS